MIVTRFCTYLADCPDAENLHHHLRYKVYCERKHYEDTLLAMATAEERDEYDTSSVRFVVKDAAEDCWMGTARLIPNCEQLLPSQALGAVDLQSSRILTDSASAEVSRLAAVSTYSSPACSSEMLKSVILGLIGHSRTDNVDWLVFLVTRGLARMLQRIDIPMYACGPVINHRGVRRAYRSNVSELIDVLPWAAPLREGSVGYEYYSAAETLAAA